MLSGVSTICFAASYAVALLLEISRLLFRSAVRGAFMLGFAAAGLVAHTAFLYYRAVNAAGAPLSSERDWYLMAAWVLIVVYLYLVFYHPQTPFGLLLLPLALGLIGTGTFAKSEPLTWAPAAEAWGIVHSVSIMLAVVSMLVALIAGLMYLGQVRRLKRKLPPYRRLRLRLPSLEWLDRANTRAIVVSVLMLALGVLSGAILNVINGSGSRGSISWYDPVVFSTVLMLAGLLVAVAVGLWRKPQHARRKGAYLTLVSFLFLIFLVITLAAMLFLSTQHGGRG
jgi:ABC-type transport system involved in cytochrome c biogenesis permease subunit